MLFASIGDMGKKVQGYLCFLLKLPICFLVLSSPVLADTDPVQLNGDSSQQEEQDSSTEASTTPRSSAGEKFVTGGALIAGLVAGGAILPLTHSLSHALAEMAQSNGGAYLLTGLTGEMAGIVLAGAGAAAAAKSVHLCGTFLRRTLARH